MDKEAAQALGRSMLESVKDYFARSIAPIVQRLDEIEKRDIHSAIAAEVSKAVAEIPKPKDADIAPAVAEIRAEVAASVEVLKAEVAAAVAAIPEVQNGKDADPEFIRAEVEKAVAEIPKPQA